jgi:TPR repeat protein
MIIRALWACTPGVLTRARLTALVAAVLCLNSTAKEPLTVATATARAERGDPRALYYLGKQYAKGAGVPQSHQKAAEYLEKAARKGHVYAQNDLGAYYSEGLGVERDYAVAVRWFRRAASRGDHLAQYSLGRAYLHGLGVETNLQAALVWLRKAASGNQCDALCLLGELYRSGRPGLKEDRALAVRCYISAANQGHAESLYTLGTLLERGQDVPRHLELARHCYQRAAEKRHLPAIARMAELSLQGAAPGKPDLTEAIKWLRIGSLYGDGNANRTLAMISTDDQEGLASYEEGCRRAGDFVRAFARQAPGP